MLTRIGYHSPEGPLLVHEIRVTLRGKILLLKSLDVDSAQRFSDYRRVSNAK